MFKEFRAFVLRGNVVDLAVGVVIGGAFGLVVASLVTNILTPILAIPGDVPDLSELVVTISGSRIRYGAFLNALITFVMTAAAVFFFVVRPVNALVACRETGPEDEPAPATRDCPSCVSSIPVAAVVCPHCTRDVAGR